MLSQNLTELFSRDIEKIRTEIKAYSSEEILWQKAEGISNSGGTLSLHLSGNLQHYFGAVLNNSGYKRDREFEFAGKVTRQQLLDDLDAADKSVKETLAAMTNQDFEKDYPEMLYGKVLNTQWFFLHLYSHLSYHLGQINYHRRLLDK